MRPLLVALSAILSAVTLTAAPSPCAMPCAAKADDAFLEGYIQNILDYVYSPCNVDAVVRNGHVVLSNVPNNCTFLKRVLNEVSHIPGVCSVRVVRCPPKECEEIAKAKRCWRARPRCGGIWLPINQNRLFEPIIADPRQPQYSAAYRVGDEVVHHVAAAVSMGDELPIYRWCNVLPWHGEMQIGLEGCIWAVFDMDTDTHNLVNADYYCGIPVTYAFDNWSFRARLYHISSHLGDEFMVSNPDILRYNPSIEALDLYAAYTWGENIRLYAGVGDYFISDRSFRQRPLYFIYGAEVKFLWWEDLYHQLAWKPFLAIFLQNKEMDDWILDQTYAVGMEVGNVWGWGRKLRVMIEYHDGFCQEGQLQRNRDSYGQFKIQYCY